MSIVEDKMRDSSTSFCNIVWPYIKQHVGNGELMSVEGHASDEMKKSLDRIAGVDFWQIYDSQSGMRGIASRVQPSSKSWGTFTIRYSIQSGGETEWHKRIRSIFYPEMGLLFPTLTVQAYVGENYGPPLYGVGIVKTKDLYLAALLKEWPKRDVNGGNTMLVLDWDKLIEHGFRVKVISGEIS